MRPYGYLSLTRSRLRAHPWYELLAAAGIAIGVALCTAVLLASADVSSSSKQLVGRLTAGSDLQLRARSSEGVPARALLRELRALPAVERVTPVLEQRAVLTGRDGSSESLDVVGAGRATGPRRIVLPPATAERLGVDPRALLRIELRGRAERVLVSAADEVGGAAPDARAGVTSLATLRALARLPDRVTRVLVAAAPGRRDAVAEELERVAGDRLDVTDLDAEDRLLRRALEPTAMATSFFAIVASLLGFLLAFNAVLLSAPERRRWLSDLISFHGASPRAVLLLVLVQSLVLGVVGSAVGVGAGVLLANGVLHASSGYLTTAFTLGSRAGTPLLPLAIGAAAGLVACLLASTPLLLDLRRGRALEAVFTSEEEAGNRLPRRLALKLAAAGLALTAGAFALRALWPGGARIGCVLLAFATVLTVPAAFRAIVAAAGLLERRGSRRLVLLSLALRELRATTLRSLALASTGAVAVFGAVAIGGARNDLLRGLDRYIDAYVGSADLWITQRDDNQGTNAFRLPAATLRQLAAVPGVGALRPYYGGFLDVADRRVWVIARAPGDRRIVPPAEVRDGDARRADAQVRGGGSVTISDRLAAALGVGVGDLLDLPTPTGTHAVRVVATTSNFGWALGAIVMRAADFRAWWGSEEPSSLEVDVAAGAVPAAVAARLRRVLAPTGLHVLPAGERAAVIGASARQGLDRIGQISALLLVSACLAMAAALGAAIWQRRPRLSQHDLLGMLPSEQWRALLIESGLVIGAGCLAGAAFGVLGQFVIDSYLVDATGFPVARELASGPAAVTFLLVMGSALAVVAIPGWLAAHVGGRAATEE